MGCVSPPSEERRLEQKTDTNNNTVRPRQEQQPRTNHAQAVKKIPIFTQPPQPISQPRPPPPPQVPPAPVKQDINSTKKEIKLTAATLSFDANCPMFASYFTGDNISFRKRSYNWFSLPIISPIDPNIPSRFSFKNLGIKFNNFVVGIIRQEDLHSLLAMPWKTEGVICYQSNTADEGSWIRNGERFKVKAKPIKKDQVVTVVVRDNFIEFWIDQQYEGRVAITQLFLEQPCLPYAAVFCEGDVFEVGGDCPIVNYYPPF